MKTSGDGATSSRGGLNVRKPALQVICLGSGGGPSEQNATAFLVRSIGSAWAKGSLVAVDAGSHFAPITRILERDFPNVSADRRGTRSSRRRSPHGRSLRQSTLSRLSLSPTPSTEEEELPKPEPTLVDSGPFSGLTLPNESARANALHVLRTYISTYLITHPHLDHISGFAINTAGFHATSRPKTLAALPSTVDAMKRHIFNDVIWPNLTDEDGGVGFVTFQRLKEGGDVMLGEGEGRGYIDVCDGLGVRAFKVSHGVCTKSPPSHQHRGSLSGPSDPNLPYSGSLYGSSQDPVAGPVTRTRSISAQFSAPGTPGFASRQTYFPNHPSPSMPATEAPCVVDSTAFFIRDVETQREVLIFGDVEPDSISLSPRNHVVWTEAARKIAGGLLGAILIECSYDDSQADGVLFGHLNPRHLIAELQTLANLVVEAKASRQLEKSARKRKRSVMFNGLDHPSPRSHPIEGDLHKRRSITAAAAATSNIPRSHFPGDSQTVNSMDTAKIFDHFDFQSDGPRSPRSTTSFPHPTSVSSSTSVPAATLQPPPPQQQQTPASPSLTDALPLKSVKVVIIHVKDTLRDGPHVSEAILAQLGDHEQRLRDAGQGLGCEFIVSESGESYYF